MFNLASQLTFNGVSINTFGLFVLFGFLLLAFVVWSEGKKDGFDEERLFDILLVSSFFSILLSRTFFAVSHSVTASALFNQIFKLWTPGFDLLGALIGFILPLYIFSKMWKWSFYRIADIFSMGFSLALSVITLGYVGLQSKFQFLFGFASWVFVYAMLSNLRNTRLKSGYGFSLFLFLNAFLGNFFFGSKDNLLFYISLVTLSFVVFVFRWRISNVDIVTRIFERIKK